MQTQAVAISDDDILAEVFRLARTGNFLRLEPLLEEAERVLPDIEPSRLKVCLRKLASRLWDSDYMGYTTEYLRSQTKSRRTVH